MKVEVKEVKLSDHRYEYNSNTHWSTIVRIHRSFGDEGEWKMQISSGGIEAGTSEVDVAESYIQIFTLAKEKLKKLQIQDKLSQR